VDIQIIICGVHVTTTVTTIIFIFVIILVLVLNLFIVDTTMATTLAAVSHDKYISACNAIKVITSVLLID